MREIIPRPNEVECWGRFPKLQPSFIQDLHWRTDPIPFQDPQAGPFLAFGQGRSYGDSCLIAEGTLLRTSGLDRLISFNPETGYIACEAGITLEELLQFTVPRGWFLPVSPGTQLVSVGGAIANDIHGKNHHSSGTFGRHILEFELIRSDGKHYLCSPTQNRELFQATIGGLGLTGVILSAGFQLKPIKNAWIDVETIKFGGLDEFFAIAAESDRNFEYTVAWIDCLAQGSHLGKGLFMRGNHSADPNRPLRPASARKITIPVDAPEFLLNAMGIRAFNTLYYNKQLRHRTQACVHYKPFFYPLDALHRWNRLYGKRGFLQYQCVVPYSGTTSAIRTILEKISVARTGSFLAVLKIFGALDSPGILSFPRPGVTLALDFPFQGRPTLELLDDLDEIVRQAGGAVYPAKDARMSAESFQRFFPRWREFAAFVDPKFNSHFWQRVSS